MVIYGGGNTAMDAARTARRLGAEEALIVYRRDRAHMPAHGFEADEALAEGVKIKWLTTIKEIEGGTMTVERMGIGADGRPQPTGEFETLQADAVVLALGQDTDSGFLRTCPASRSSRDGTVIVGPDMMTGAPGIFAGGDMVPSERTVTVAVGHGKLAARNIDGWLRGVRYRMSPEPPGDFAMLNLPVYSDADPTPQRALPASDRRRRVCRSARRAERDRGAARGATLPLLRQSVSNATTATPPARRMRSTSSGRAPAIACRCALHRLRRVLRAVPVPRHRNDRGTSDG